MLEEKRERKRVRVSAVYFRFFILFILYGLFVHFILFSSFFVFYFPFFLHQTPLSLHYYEKVYYDHFSFSLLMNLFLFFFQVFPSFLSILFFFSFQFFSFVRFSCVQNTQHPRVCVAQHHSYSIFHLPSYCQAFIEFSIVYEFNLSENLFIQFFLPHSQKLGECVLFPFDFRFASPFLFLIWCVALRCVRFACICSISFHFPEFYQKFVASVLTKSFVVRGMG